MYTRSLTTPATLTPAPTTITTSYGLNIGHGFVKSVVSSLASADDGHIVVFPSQIAPAPAAVEGACSDRARYEAGGAQWFAGYEAPSRSAQTLLSSQRLSSPVFVPVLTQAALDAHGATQLGYCVTGLPATWSLDPQKCRQLAERLRQGTDLFAKIRVIAEPLGLIHALSLNSVGDVTGDPALRDGVVLVVDWGFHTLDLAIVDRLFPDRTTFRTFDLGMARALVQIQAQLQAVFGRDYSLHEVDEAVRSREIKAAGGWHPLPAGWDAPIVQLGVDAVGRITESVGLGAGVDLLLLGGGSVGDPRLAEALIAAFPNSLIDHEPQTAIARGYRNLGMRFVRGLE
jgi:hypothetical protein